MKRQQGISLVELMIGLVLGLLLVAGVLSIFVAYDKTQSDTLQTGELQENGRFAMDILAREVMQAGFLGQFTGGSLQSAVNVNIDNNLAAVNPDCVGGGLNNASLPNFSSANFRLLWATVTTDNSVLSCIDDARKSTGLIQFKRFFGRMIINEQQDIASGDGDLTAADIAAAGVNVNRVFALANSNRINFFSGTSDPQSDQRFTDISNGEVWEYQHRVYYVADQARYGTKVPVLRRKVLQIVDGSPAMVSEELVEGIEDMRFEFGIDTDADGAPNQYLAISEMTDNHWDGVGGDIVAVRIYVLVRSLFPDPSYSNDVTYQLADYSYAPADHYRRLLMLTTIQLRNPL